ncbi:hypothetical protein CK203_042927 [Vitis vinifera]|uniref:Disease resistance protein At4g27190-like leucine-rich repeats domain-containing protein n=1 Tax=Vitis vinifera TaxID=29760 RepID=A0A438HUK7_VITVI|nr:hypothetical protein CK203_042927 [Vitis vinifera]
MVDNCSSLEAVFDVEGTNVNVDLEELNVDDGHVELLPKLGELRLIGLPKLRHICNCGSSRNHFPSSMASAPVGNIIFPKLFHIFLKSLPNLTSFVSPGYHSLQRLHHADLDTPFPVLFDERVAFPSLNSLTIRGLDNVKKIWPNQIPQDSFSKLEDVKVLSCGQLLNIFPSCMLKRLQRLMVDYCSSLEAVFDVEGTNVNVDLEELNVDDGHVELLPKLKELRLFGLPKLRHICNCGSSTNHFPSSMASAPVGNIIFPKLSDIILVSLPNLTSFVSPGYHSLQRLHHADLDTPSRCSLMKGSVYLSESSSF